MIRTGNVLDVAGLKKVYERYALRDDVADLPLKRLDQALDAVRDVRTAVDDWLVALDEEGFTLAERRALYLAVRNLSQQALDRAYQRLFE